MMNGHAKTNGHAGHAKPAPRPEAPRPPAEPLAFVDEFPTKVRAAIETAGTKQYAEGMRRATRIIAIAVGRLDGDSKQRIVDIVEQLENEATVAEKGLRAP